MSNEGLGQATRKMRDAGVGAVAMEVTSHALSLNRVDGIVFDVAVFLNFSQDHLDLHGSMEAYFAAKASLFTPERAARAVVDTTGDAGRRLAEQATIDGRGGTYDVFVGKDLGWLDVIAGVTIGRRPAYVAWPLNGGWHLAWR